MNSASRLETLNKQCKSMCLTTEAVVEQLYPSGRPAAPQCATARQRLNARRPCHFVAVAIEEANCVFFKPLWAFCPLGDCLTTRFLCNFQPSTAHNSDGSRSGASRQLRRPEPDVLHKRLRPVGNFQLGKKEPMAVHEMLRGARHWQCGGGGGMCFAFFRIFASRIV